MGNTYKIWTTKFYFGLALTLLLLGIHGKATAQSGLCDPNTPFYVVDLSTQVNGSFVTPQDRRVGNCCGTSAPDRCVEFEITLHPNALGISFDIYSGAVPTGSMFYQINCGPPIAVGQAVCLQGVGPHTVTFCKPGNNPNAYIIRSIPPPYTAPDNEVRVGCSIELETNGLTPSTISWSDVTSGTGAYDSLLSCLSGCSTTYFSPQPGAPAYIDYEVCGAIFDTLCNNMFTVCDTLRVFVYPELEVPDLDTVYYCITNGGVTLQGNAYGGFGSYEYYWYDSSGNVLGNGNSYFASTPGVYQLEIRDDLYPNCPADLQDIEVLPDMPATVNAGLDTLICSAAPVVTLNGTASNVNGAIWSGGTGSYGYPNDSLTNTYYPTPTEITNGSVLIELSSKPDTACPVAIDQKVVQFRAPPVLGVTDAADLSCYQSGDGNINVSTTGGTPPYNFDWNNGFTVEDLNDLDSGYYELIVTDDLGCTDTIGQLIDQPTPLIGSISVSNVSCYGSDDGSITAMVTGGTIPYNTSWSNGSNTLAQSSLIAGTYTVTITDANGCSIILDTIVTQPDTFIVNITNTQHLTCFGSNDGAISLSVIGGTPGYNFVWSSGATSQNLSNIGPGNYTVTVTDANGCSKIASTIVNQPPALQGSLLPTYVSCYGGSNGTLDMNPSGGTTPYTYLWSNGATTQDLNGIVAGVYTITLTDANGCSLTRTQTIFEPTELVVSNTSSNVSCYGATDGSIDVTVSGGRTPYSYLWSGGQTTQDIQNIPAGTHTLTLTDNNGCVVNLPVVITQPNAIEFSATTSPASCNGGSNGAIDLSVTGGSAPYTYIWNTGATTQDLTGIIADNYRVTVTDANGCTNDTVVIVNEPNVIITQIDVVSNVSCFGGNNGALDLSVSGGAGTYTYQWSSGASSQDVNNLVADEYFVTVNDANNCRSITSATITQPTEIIPTTATSDITCNGANDGSIDLEVTGGIPPYTYLWSSGATSQDLNNLTGDTYTVTITDANNCSISITDTVIDPDPITVPVYITNVNCNGGANGFIEITPMGGVSPFTYTWSNGSTLPFLFNLTAGTYHLTLTDANGCTLNFSYDVTQPDPILLNENINNVSCFGGSNGSISINPTGGTTPYSYNWSGGGTSNSISGLLAGNYTVTVRDGNFCTTTASYSIGQPDSLRVQASVTNVACIGQSNGAIDLTVNGGTGPYVYSWSNWASMQDINNLPAGNYTVTVTDANGCSNTLSRQVTEPLTLTIALTKEDILCFGDNNGSVNTTVTGGTTPYSYIWSNGLTSPNILNQLAGNYRVTVTDARGCTIIGQTTITQPTVLNLTGTSTNLSCFEANDGSIDITASGGTSPYTYTWLSGSTSEDLTNLAIGDYYVTVTDANGCEAFYNAQLTQPTQIVLNSVAENASCNGIPDGNIDLNVAGGVSPYTYLWSTGQTSQDLMNIAAGGYQVTVTDAIGCTAQQIVLVNEPSNLQIDATPAQHVSCNGGNDGAIDLSLTGSVGVSQISWSSGSNTQNIGQLIAGDYFVTVTDVNGCRIIDVATITEPDPLDVIPTIVDVTCYGLSNGSVDISVSGGTAPYQYNWGGNGSGTLSNPLSAGNYSLIVTDDNNCNTTLNYAIEQPGLLSANTNILNNVSCFGGVDGSAAVIVQGGTPPYVTVWSDGSTNSINNNLPIGTHTVDVIDSNGCTTSTQVVITQPDTISITITNTNVSCKTGSDGTLTANVTGGTAPYSYNWSNTDTNNVATNLTAGIYTLTVTDANGCTQVSMGRVMEPDTIYHQFVTSNVNCFLGNDGSAIVTAGGGTAPYTYVWSNGATSDTIDQLTADIYTVTITDRNGCSYIADTTITQPDSLQLIVTSTDITCKGANDGSASVLLTGGSGGYSYLWSTGETTSAISNLAPGTYTYQISDQGNCTIVDSILINEPDSLLAETQGTEWICVGTTNGSIAAVGSGGTPPYSYLWSNGSTAAALSNLAAGTYTVTITDTNGCSNSSIFTIQEIINQLSLSANQVCVNDTVNFIGATNAGFSIAAWEWSFGDGTTDTTPYTTHTYTTDGTMDIVLVVESTDGCRDTMTDQIVVNPLPNADAGLDAPICVGDTTALKATGGVSYQWTPATDMDDPTSPTTNVYPAVDRAYVVEVTDANGCINTDTVNITVNLAPSVDLGPDTMVCKGDTILLAAPAGYQYQWQSGSNNGLQCTNCAAPLIYPTTDDLYSVTVTNNLGCSTADTIKVRVVELPGGINVATYNICQYNAITLQGPLGQYNYSWTPTSIINDPTHRLAVVSNLDTNTTFTLVTSDQYGCTTVDSATITVNPVPVNYLPDTLPYCGPDSIQLQAPQGMQHTWANTDDISCTQCADPWVAPTSNTVYTVMSTTVDGCLTTDSVQVIVNTPPTTNLGGTVKFCKGSSFTIPTNIIGGATYFWSPSIGLNDPSAARPVATPASDMTYYVMILDTNGCIVNDSVRYLPTDGPAIVASNDTTVCAGDYAILRAASAYSIAGGLDIKWYNSNGTLISEADSIITNPNDTEEYLAVIESDGCIPDTAIASVGVRQPPVVEIDEMSHVLQDDTIELNATHYSNYAYQWSVNNDTCIGCSSVSVVAGSSNTYSVTVTDDLGCSSEAIRQVKVYTFCGTEVFIPNSFSPNRDGKNDMFQVRSTVDIEVSSMLVFDRWGNKVFESNLPDASWNGVYKSQMVDPGVFVYHMEVRCPNGQIAFFKGNVTVLR